MNRADVYTEVYRRFEGELRDRKPRWLPVYSAGIRVALVRKLPLLLLYGLVGIWTVIQCSMVYGIFVFQEELPEQMDMQTMLLAGLAQQLVDVKGILSSAYSFLFTFAVLAAAWYGSGLISEDRRSNAHLYYFARPFGRLDYVLAKFSHAFTFAAFASIVPGLVVCLVAVFVSPRWSFLTQEPETIGYALLYSTAWSAAISALVLALSSLAPRKAFALIGFVGILSVSAALSNAMAFTLKDTRWWIVSLTGSFDVLRRWFFSTGLPDFGPPREHELVIDPDVLLPGAIASIAIWTTLSLLVLAWRVRKLEVVS